MCYYQNGSWLRINLALGTNRLGMKRPWVRNVRILRHLAVKKKFLCQVHEFEVKTY